MVIKRAQEEITVSVAYNLFWIIGPFENQNHRESLKKN